MLVQGQPQLHTETLPPLPAQKKEEEEEEELGKETIAIEGGGGMGQGDTRV